MSTLVHPPQPHPAVLIASSDVSVRKQLVERLDTGSWPVTEAVGGADALQKLESSECQLLVLDSWLPDLDAGELSSLIEHRYPGVDVLAVESRAGGRVRPLRVRSEPGRVLARTLMDSGAAPATDATPAAQPLPQMIGSSAAMQRVYTMVRRVAPHETPVLVCGDSGTGKELVANAIHRLSRRAEKPLVVINCAAIPEALLEAELFGYVRGAFTGAAQSRSGRIQSAHGGTLFLDEIGEMPLGLQSKLLRFVEQKEVQRLGSSDVFRVDVRLIAATNVHLERAVAQHKFRSDLFYRLCVFPVALPPLSSRTEDVPELAHHFAASLSLRACTISPEALDVLRQHAWPGNVRELRHVIERAAILADGPVIRPEHIVLHTMDLLP